MDLPDAIRQIEKAADVLEKVEIMMNAEAEMNAAKHMSENVLHNPLSSAVSTTLQNLRFSLERFSGEEE